MCCSAAELCRACRSVRPVNVCLPELIVHTLVSSLQGRRVRQHKRQPCKYLLERFFAFNTKDGRTVLFRFALHVSSTTRTSSVNCLQFSAMTMHQPLPIAV